SRAEVVAPGVPVGSLTCRLCGCALYSRSRCCLISRLRCGLIGRLACSLCELVISCLCIIGRLGVYRWCRQCIRCNRMLVRIRGCAKDDKSEDEEHETGNDTTTDFSASRHRLSRCCWSNRRRWTNLRGSLGCTLSSLR